MGMSVMGDRAVALASGTSTLPRVARWEHPAMPFVLTILVWRSTESEGIEGAVGIGQSRRDQPSLPQPLPSSPRSCSSAGERRRSRRLARGAPLTGRGETQRSRGPGAARHDQGPSAGREPMVPWWSSLSVRRRSLEQRTVARGGPVPTPAEQEIRRRTAGRSAGLVTARHERAQAELQ